MGKLIPLPRKKEVVDAEEAARAEIESKIAKWAFYSGVIWAISGPEKAQLFLEKMATKVRRKHGLDG